MKSIKESSEDSSKECPNVEKTNEDEPNQLSSNSKDINNITSEFINLNINSEQTQLQKNEIPIVNKENNNNKLKVDLEDNQGNINKNDENIGKKKLSSSQLDKKGINNNKKIKTPIKQHNSPLNFQLKKNINFQMKSRKNTYTESDINSSAYYNSKNIKSPIYSYFDQSQKFLSENYNEDNNYFNYTENKNNKKTAEAEENNHKKIKTTENIEISGLQPIKTDKSIEHDNESMNYNDFNLFMSPDFHNSSQVSAGLNNNLQTNKISSKSSLASYKRGNSENKIVNSGMGENDNIDFNLDLPLNESNDEYSNNMKNMNNNNDEMKHNKDMNNIHMNNNNFVLGNLGNPWLIFNNKNMDNINYISKMNQLNNQNNNINFNSIGNNLNNNGNNKL